MQLGIYRCIFTHVDVLMEVWSGAKIRRRTPYMELKSKRPIREFVLRESAVRLAPGFYGYGSLLTIWELREKGLA